MARVYIPGGSTYQNVEQPMQTVTERVKTGSEPAFSFFGMPFGSKPVYSDVQREVPLRTPVSSYGINDAGRTYPFNPNPTAADYRTVYGSASAPQWANTGGTKRTALLPGLFGKLLNLKSTPEPYEAALRERPGDVQNLVSMTRRPTFGMPVDSNSNFNR